MRALYFIVAILVNLDCYTFALAVDSSYGLPQTTLQQKNINSKNSGEDIEAKLKHLSASAHHLQKTIHEIIFEITGQEYVTASEPNVIGPVVVPAFPPPTGVIATGDFLPPRKKYMDFYLEQTRNLLTMLNEEAMSLPDKWGADNEVSNNLINFKKSLNDLRIKIEALLNSMAGPEYDNLDIGKRAIQISDDLDRIQKLLKECEKYIHKDIKQTGK